jgi:uncharacterized membrane protein YkoI
MTRPLALLLTLAAFATVSPQVAWAQAAPGGQPGSDSLGADWGPQQDEARAGVKQGRYVPLLRVITEIRQRTPGRQLDAGLEQAGGRAVYRVRWATNDGRRIDYLVDAETGAILSAK